MHTYVGAIICAPGGSKKWLHIWCHTLRPVNDETADTIFSGKFYGTKKSEDDNEDNVNTSESNERDNLSNEGVGVYNSGSQVSAVSDDASDKMSVTI